jgi:ribosomal protein S19
MRSSWKIKPLSLSIFRQAYYDKLGKQDAISVWAKDTRVFSNLLEKKLQVYNGTKFVEINVSKEMLGRAIGGFVLTKRITSDIHSKTHKNKKGRRKKKK